MWSFTAFYQEQLESVVMSVTIQPGPVGSLKSWYDAEEEFADDAEEESLPIGIDPISGKAVGKATAIIAADANNHVFYFEKEAKVNKANAKLREK